MLRRRAVFALAFATLAFAPRRGFAQELGAVPLNRFDAAPAGDPFFGVPSPFIAGHLAPRLAALVDYAHRPLILKRGEELGAVVAHQAFLHLDGSAALWNRLLISAVLPIAVSQSGDGPLAYNMPTPGPPSSAVGDLRLGVRLRLSGVDDDESPQFAVGADLHLPIASSAGSFVSDGSTRIAPHLLTGGRSGALVWTLMLGAKCHTTSNPWALAYGGGAGVRVWDDTVQLGVEIIGATTFHALVAAVQTDDDSDVQLTGEYTYFPGANRSLRQNIGTNLEMLFGARAKLPYGVTAGLGAGPGILHAVGTPEYRIVGIIGWGQDVGAEDVDRDGVPDKDDGCPDAFGSTRAASVRSGCPISDDSDADGVRDPNDACPDEKGVRSKDWRFNGCPARDDTDGDRVRDDADACPDQKGARGDDPKKSGCPEAKVADSDGDGLSDDMDACPREKGEAGAADPKYRGCPDKDGDGVFDKADVCPEEKGAADADPKMNGCPPDKDGDGVPDQADVCPDRKGVQDAKRNGCPGDGDGDGVLDDVDACPRESGPSSEDRAAAGCPAFVRVREDEIVLLAPIRFKLVKGGAVQVDPASEPILAEVIQVMGQHPEILLIEVQGHTDNTKGEAFSVSLSRWWAEAVVKWMVDHGAAADRLVAKGYGMTTAAAANDTAEGRQKNDRIQFFVARKK